jgi:hypothetical protein
MSPSSFFALSDFIRRFPGSPRAREADEALFAIARAKGSSEAYFAYLQIGTLHAREVEQEILPTTAWREAQATGTIGSYGLFFTDYPLSPHAKEADEAMFALAKEADSRSGYQAYLAWDGSHREEIEQGLLPAAAFREAKEDGTVTALRYFLGDYPEGEHTAAAKEAIHALFTEALSDFRAQAAASPELIPFMQKLLAYQEANDSPAMQIRFRAPGAESLSALDELLAKEEIRKAAGIDKKMAPVSPYFSDEYSIPREEVIASLLEDAFGEIFPSDILEVVRSTRITDPPGTAFERPTIEVFYEIATSGRIYASPGEDRAYVGIAFQFRVSLWIPGEGRPYSFRFAVEPPEKFSVEYKSSYAGFDASPYGPSDDQIYGVMALRAFDTLAAKLQRSFFKPGTDAYRVIEREGQADEE